MLRKQDNNTSTTLQEEPKQFLQTFTDFQTTLILHVSPFELHSLANWGLQCLNSHIERLLVEIAIVWLEVGLIAGYLDRDDVSNDYATSKLEMTNRTVSQTSILHALFKPLPLVHTNFWHSQQLILRDFTSSAGTRTGSQEHNKYCKPNKLSPMPEIPPPDGIDRIAWSGSFLTY